MTSTRVIAAQRPFTASARDVCFGKSTRKAPDRGKADFNAANIGRHWWSQRRVFAGVTFEACKGSGQFRPSGKTKNVAAASSLRTAAGSRCHFVPPHGEKVTPVFANDWNGLSPPLVFSVDRHWHWRSPPRVFTIGPHGWWPLRIPPAHHLPGLSI